MRRTRSRLLATGPTAAVLVVALAAGCGDESGEVADPAPTESTIERPGETPGETATGYEVGDVVPHERVALITESAAGGEVSPQAVVIDDADDLARFVAGFDSDRLLDEVTAAVDEATPDPDEAVVAALVDLGCDPPEEVVVLRTGQGVRVARADKPDSELNCFVAMTTVAVLTVPAVAVDPA
ncbi:hypothetical protein [Nocardioides ferulae]|uniref:hypothetical protein n=1 Tax=Nocardioides ferulae TaxID=2340821 RepID=UPI000EB51B6D|nr:hypothetical protein [Nocardioides ferulae]